MTEVQGNVAIKQIEDNAAFYAEYGHSFPYTKV